MEDINIAMNKPVNIRKVIVGTVHLPFLTVGRSISSGASQPSPRPPPQAGDGKLALHSVSNQHLKIPRY